MSNLYPALFYTQPTGMALQLVFWTMISDDGDELGGRGEPMRQWPDAEGDTRLLLCHEQRSKPAPKTGSRSSAHSDWRRSSKVLSSVLYKYAYWQLPWESVFGTAFLESKIGYSNKILIKF